jgi:hypothetical protein
MSDEEKSLRLSQLNDLHNQLVNTEQEKFCPALRWALSALGCPDAVAPRAVRPLTEKCDWCDGEKQWCSVCQVYTRTCCVDYGTCQCS